MSELAIASRIGLGLAALGRPGYINLGHAEDLNGTYDPDMMEERSHRVLDEAFENGVRYFDAARSYGRAEEFLGSWLASRGIDPSDITVGSKWGYKYTADWQVDADVHEQKEHSLARLDDQWGKSVEVLGTHLDLYQIHSATLDTGVLENKAVLDRLAELKRGGIAIGLSTSGANQGEVILQALEVAVDGVRLFDAVQSTWNILETSASEALRLAHDTGLKVIVKEAVANGRLTSRNESDDFVSGAGTVGQIATAHNVGVDAVAIACVLAQPWATVALSGAARIDHLQSNLAALDVVLTDEELAQLEGLAERPESYWEKRGNLDWN